MFDLFGSEVDTPLPALELEPQEERRQELLSWEKELLGTYISEHPFKNAAKALEDFTTVQAAELSTELAGQEAAVAGTVIGVRRLTTRQGKPFAAVVIEDLSGNVELTVWPDGYERYRELLIEGNVLLARVEVRQRGDRLTVAVQELAAYDPEARSLIDFDPSRFRPRSQRADSRSSSGSSDGAAPDNGPPNVAPRAADDAAGGANGRSRLRAVEASPPPPPEPSSRLALEAQVGPPRLHITMEETTDEHADRRRLEKVLARLTAQPGELPVELMIQTRDGRLERLQLHDGVAMSQDLVPQIKGLLGVLGNAGEVGDRAPADTATASAG